MIIEKKHEGKYIYAIPTGNNARYGNKNVVKFLVIKVNRKYVEMSLDGSTYSDKYCVSSGATQSAINAGYGANSGFYFYDSLEDIEKEEQQRIKLKQIKEGVDKLCVDSDKIEALYSVLFGGCQQL